MIMILMGISLFLTNLNLKLISNHLYQRWQKIKKEIWNISYPTGLSSYSFINLTLFIFHLPHNITWQLTSMVTFTVSSGAVKPTVLHLPFQLRPFLAPKIVVVLKTKCDIRMSTSTYYSPHYNKYTNPTYNTSLLSKICLFSSQQQLVFLFFGACCQGVFHCVAEFIWLGFLILQGIDSSFLMSVCLFWTDWYFCKSLGFHLSSTHGPFSFRSCFIYIQKKK